MYNIHPTSGFYLLLGTPSPPPTIVDVICVYAPLQVTTKVNEPIMKEQSISPCNSLDLLS